MTVHVRLATVRDASALAEVAAETFPLACPEPLDPADIQTHIRTELSEDRFTVDLAPGSAITGFVLEIDGTTAGYATLRKNQPPVSISTSAPVEILRFYVRQAFHGQQGASTLLTTILDHARAEGHDIAWLGTSVLNERAKRFYGKHGFAEAGLKSFMVGPVEATDVVMVRNPI